MQQAGEAWIGRDKEKPITARAEWGCLGEERGRQGEREKGREKGRRVRERVPRAHTQEELCM